MDIFIALFSFLLLYLLFACYLLLYLHIFQPYTLCVGSAELKIKRAKTKKNLAFNKQQHKVKTFL